MKATKKAPVKKAKKAPAKPKVKEVIVRWDIINPLDGELFGLAAELGKSKYMMQEHPNGDILLKKIPEKKAGLWRPQYGEHYYYVSSDFTVLYTRNFEDADDGRRISYGNCYPTKEQAEKAAILLRRTSIFISAALNADPDAGGWAEDRPRSISNILGKLGVYKSLYYVDQPAWVHTKEQAEHMLEILKAECWK